MTTDQNSRKTLVIFGVLVAVLVGSAVVLALRPPPEFSPSAPEGAVQAYYQAVLDDDEDLASTYLVEDLRDRCDTGFMEHGIVSRFGVVIVHTEVKGAEAEIEVEITETYGEGPFDAGSYTFNENLALERHDDRWLIADIKWPMDIYCLEEFH